MIRHFFIDKTNSIIKDSFQNMGLNPILHVSYGSNIIRGLIHFDIEEIKNLIEDKTFADVDKLHFNLKMTNCFSIDGSTYNTNLIRDGKAKRATSFELMLFKLPCEFDAGRGFDYISDFWIGDNHSFSTDGSTWYTSKTLVPWIDYDKEYIKENDKGGIFSMDFLISEYENFKENKESIIIGTQKFDFGNENLCIDITNYVLDCVKTNKNYGLCLCFSPLYENSISEEMNCVNFFTDNTNTFFHPYVEAIYNEYMMDSRNNFTSNKNDKLYLTVYNDGELCNLDSIPSCSIEDIELNVKQMTKGVYCAQILNNDIKLEEDTVYYDKWSKMSLNSVKIDDVERELFVRKNNNKINIGKVSSSMINVVPSVYGINDSENLNQGEVREVIVDFREKYTTDKRHLIAKAEYRLYVKDGNRELDILQYQPIEMAEDINFFNIYTMDLIPNEYFIDIKVTNGQEKNIFKNVLRFNIISNITERYQ